LKKNKNNISYDEERKRKHESIKEEKVENN